MSDGDQKDGSKPGVISASERQSIKDRAGEIDRRLDDARARITPPPEADPRVRGQAMGQGFKIAIDLVVGVAFGGFVGWWLDQYLGTRPWLMILLVVLGFAAGMMNVIRTARRLQAQAEAAQLAASAMPKDMQDDDD